MTKTCNPNLHLLAKAFTHVLKGLTAMKRFAKTFDPEDVAFVIAILPLSVQQELTGPHLFWAAQQLLLDPEPFGEMHLAIALLRYLYPCEAGMPRFDLGLRPDLEVRMASEKFVPITPTRADLRPAREVVRAEILSPQALLEAAPLLPHLRTREQRVAHLENLALLTGVPDPRQPLVEVIPDLQHVEA